MRDHRGKLLAVGDEYQVGDYLAEQLIRDGAVEPAAAAAEAPESPTVPAEAPAEPEAVPEVAPEPESAPESPVEAQPEEAPSPDDGA